MIKRTALGIYHKSHGCNSQQKVSYFFVPRPHHPFIFLIAIILPSTSTSSLSPSASSSQSSSITPSASTIPYLIAFAFPSPSTFPIVVADHPHKLLRTSRVLSKFPHQKLLQWPLLHPTWPSHLHPVSPTTIYSLVINNSGGCSWIISDNNPSDQCTLGLPITTSRAGRNSALLTLSPFSSHERLTPLFPNCKSKKKLPFSIHTAKVNMVHRQKNQHAVEYSNF